MPKRSPKEYFLKFAILISVAGFCLLFEYYLMSFFFSGASYSEFLYYCESVKRKNNNSKSIDDQDIDEIIYGDNNPKNLSDEKLKERIDRLGENSTDSNQEETSTNKQDLDDAIDDTSKQKNRIRKKNHSFDIIYEGPGTRSIGVKTEKVNQNEKCVDILDSHKEKKQEIEISSIKLVEDTNGRVKKVYLKGSNDC